MVRPFTHPDDVHGMLAAKGILTSEGGATSHAAVVARQFGVPCVVGASDVRINLAERKMTVGDITVDEGDWVSLDGATGEVYLGQIATIVPKFEEQTDLITLLSWADEIRRLRGVGQRRLPGRCPARPQLRRSGHRPLPHRAHVLRRGAPAHRAAHDPGRDQRGPHRGAGRAAALPAQRLRRASSRRWTGLPVIIRLIDPPLHEFMPDHDEIFEEVITKRVNGADRGSG